MTSWRMRLVAWLLRPKPPLTDREARTIIAALLLYAAGRAEPANAAPCTKAEDYAGLDVPLPNDSIAALCAKLRVAWGIA